MMLYLPINHHRCPQDHNIKDSERQSRGRRKEKETAPISNPSSFRLLGLLIVICVHMYCSLCCLRQYLH